MIYPNGRVLAYSYGATNGIDDAASRVVSLIDNDGTTHLADYSYVGLRTFVETDCTQPDVKYTLIGTAGGNDPDTGDIYRGLDRFGRVKDSYWYNYGSGTDADRVKYGYDRIGNRVYRENTVAAAAGAKFDELYQYDAIHRLKHMDRGTLDGSKTGFTSTTFKQCWTLDETGNWRGFRQDDSGDGTWDLVQSRTSNLVNEISDISETVGSSWVTPTYSRAGNMTTVPQPLTPTASYGGTYDSWNRLVKLVSGASTVAEYQYDGIKRRIVQKSYTAGTLTETRHFYYTIPTQWQVIEERLGTSPSSAGPNRQFIWGLRYIDDLVLRERDTNGDGVLDERLYALQDANWNVTGFVNTSGVVQQRMQYAAYGQPIVLSAAWTVQADPYSWEVMYAGYRRDPGTGLFYVRNRPLHPQLGIWLERDPAASNPYASLYEYCLSNPVSVGDSSGLKPPAGPFHIVGGDDLPIFSCSYWRSACYKGANEDLQLKNLISNWENVAENALEYARRIKDCDNAFKDCKDPPDPDPQNPKNPQTPSPNPSPWPTDNPHFTPPGLNPTIPPLWLPPLVPPFTPTGSGPPGPGGLSPLVPPRTPTIPTRLPPIVPPIPNPGWVPKPGGFIVPFIFVPDYLLDIMTGQCSRGIA